MPIDRGAWGSDPLSRRRAGFLLGTRKVRPGDCFGWNTFLISYGGLAEDGWVWRWYGEQGGMLFNDKNCIRVVLGMVLGVVTREGY